jgi:hypothetical protein
MAQKRAVEGGVETPFVYQTTSMYSTWVSLICRDRQIVFHVS